MCVCLIAAGVDGIPRLLGVGHSALMILDSRRTFRVAAQDLAIVFAKQHMQVSGLIPPPTPAASVSKSIRPKALVVVQLHRRQHSRQPWRRAPPRRPHRLHDPRLPLRSAVKSRYLLQRRSQPSPTCPSRCRRTFLVTTLRRPWWLCSPAWTRWRPTRSYCLRTSFSIDLDIRNPCRPRPRTSSTCMSLTTSMLHLRPCLRYRPPVPDSSGKGR